jgi:speckle-type POZ protein
MPGFIPHVKVSMDVAPQREGWKSYKFNIHDFAAIDQTRGDCFYSPEFSCNGHRWGLDIYPGGCSKTLLNGCISIYLANCSKGGISATFEMKVLNKFGGVDWNTNQLTHSYRPNDEQAWGWPNFCLRSHFLDPSKNILDDDGTLAVVVSMKEESPALKPFIPKNPCQNMLQKKFLDEETSDVCFEVSRSDVAKVRSKRKRSKESVKFHAHILILQMCAPMLAALFAPEEDGESAIASIDDVKPDIFRHLLCYVYGGSVPEEVLKQHAKDFIDTADKYSIVNLKLEAEAAYVESNDITMDNAIDNLLYADAKNCALLKEAVLDFLAENSVEAAQNISFSDVPGHIINDLLVAVGRSKKSDVSGKNGDKYSTMRVSELRRMLDEKGPREAMIETLKSMD